MLLSDSLAVCSRLYTAERGAEGDVASHKCLEVSGGVKYMILNRGCVVQHTAQHTGDGDSPL